MEEHPLKEQCLEDLTHSLMNYVDGLKKISIKELFDRHGEDINRDRLYAYSNVCGIACSWEAHVKFFAHLIGVDIYESKPRKKAKSPVTKDIETITDDLKDALPKIDLKFGRLINLRNALVHANFHQIRTVASESKRKDKRTSYKGNTVMFSENFEEAQNLSEMHEFEDVKKTGLFWWFVDVSNLG
jgi:hypothetical protein